MIGFSWDDGALEDLKLYELHEKYDIPGMFFVPTHNCEGRAVVTPEIIRSAESENVKFGGHTQNHRYLTTISIQDAETEVRDNLYYLQDTLGHKIDDFCFPGGQYNNDILSLVYKYYKTARTGDTMSFRHNCGPLKPSIHFYPRGGSSIIVNCIRQKSFFELLYSMRYLRKDYFTVINKLIGKDINRPDKAVMIWGHSWEIEKLGLWDELENLMKGLKGKCSKYSDFFEQ